MLLHIYLDIFCFNSVSEHFTKNISMLAHQKCKNRHTVFTKVMGGGKLNAVRKISRINLRKQPHLLIQPGKRICMNRNREP